MTRADVPAPRPPIPGKDAELVFHVTRTDLPPADAGGMKIDFRELSPFQEVKQGALIAEKIPAEPGMAGINAEGGEIPAPPGKDIEFAVAHNVIQSTENGRVVYRAAVDGILTFTHSTANIEEALNLDRVNALTGNIKTDHNVHIHGDITSGFRVDCGGNLYVKGAIENASHVRCKGSLMVEGGILGGLTEVEVGADAVVGYFQNSSAVVNGNLTILKYAFDARLVCRGALKVEGRTVKGTDRGSVVGGCLNSVGSMDLHSVGSDTNHTHLICGFDAQKWARAHELEELAASLDKQVATLQHRMGLDLDDPHVAEKLRCLPEPERRRLRAILVDFKKCMAERERVQDQRQALAASEKAPSQTTSTLRIRYHQVGSVTLEFDGVTRVITKDARAVSYSSVGGELNVAPLGR